jgi:hypothetical protein
MYRAQRLAEYALYDKDPTLIDTELDQYLAITPDEIKAAVANYLDVDNKVTLDIIPAALAEPPAEAASTLQAGETQQPTAPPPQVPASPAESETKASVIGSSNGGQIEPPQQPADPPKQTETGSGPLHT